MSLSPHLDVCEGPRYATEPNKLKNNKSNLENLQGNISTRDVYRTLSNIIIIIIHLEIELRNLLNNLQLKWEFKQDKTTEDT